MERFINQIVLGDCMGVLRQLPDKCVDLLLTDPPYGSRNATSGVVRTGGTWAAKYGTKIHLWDTPPL